MRLKILVHFDGIFVEKAHGIVMEFDVIVDQNSDGKQWWHFIMNLWFVFCLTAKHERFIEDFRVEFPLSIKDQVDDSVDG